MARNIIVFVADGLRPGSIKATDTPTMFGIKQNGVNFANSHSLFPTFTTPNASAIATGHYLGDTGDFSNTVYTGYPVINANGSITPFIENDPVLADINANSNLADPDTSFSNRNFLTEESLLAYARTQGYSTAAIGKIGPVVIQDPTQDVRTCGAATPNITPKTVILDDATYINTIANATTPPASATSGSQLAVPVSTTIANDLNAVGLIGGIVPGSITATNPTGTVATQIASIRSNQPAGNLTTAGTLNSNAQQQQYFADATTKAVLPQFVADLKGGASKGFATVYWSRDPDGTLHNNGDAFNAADPGNNSLTMGINGPTAKKGVANADANLAQIIAYLKATDDPANPGKKLYDNTDIFVTADHGFSTISKQAVGVTFDAAGTPTFIPTKSYAATLDYYTTDATTGVKTPTVHKGFLPPGFVAIDLAKDLSATLYDPNKPTAPVPTANINNIQYTAIDPTLGQLTTSGNGVIGGTGKVTNGVIDAGTKVVVAANGGSDLLYVPSNDPALVKQIVALLAQKDYISGIFTDDKFGDVPGALKMSTIGLIGNSELPAPSIAINFKTFSTNPKDPNDPYTQVEVADTTLQQGQGMHGTFGRGDTFNNMSAIGPDFKTGYTDNVPVSNADVVPTLASILGWTIPSVGKLVGRVATEAIVGGATVSYGASTLVSTPVNGVSTVLNIQNVGTTQYFDVAGFPGGSDGLAATAFSGVAAGDATTNAAILWTRTFDPVTKNGISTKLNLQVATDTNFTTPLTLAATTDPTHDYTTKVDVTGLKSGTQYYYRFQTATGTNSQVGTFKTALDSTVAAPVRFAFSGDANGSSNPADDVNTTGAFINKTAEFKNIERAYLEYQPVREKIISAPNDPRTDNTQQLFFAQQWGKNSIFVNVDSRTYRDVRLNKADGKDDTGARADNPNRTLLGATQLSWLKKTLLDAQTAGTPWKFVTTSDPIDQIGAVGSGDDGGKSWFGGYRAERNELLKFIADNGIKNVVFLATDDHLLRIDELTYSLPTEEIGIHDSPSTVHHPPSTHTLDV